MTRSLSTLAFAAALLLTMSIDADAEDLIQVYREALLHDPALAAARANWQATQERVPQARAGLLPNVTLSASTNANYFGTDVDSDPRVTVNRSFGLAGLTVSAAQPLYRYANQVAYSQAVQQVEQADFTLASARQDLILRVATAYFDVLLAQFNVEVTESRRLRFPSNLRKPSGISKSASRRSRTPTKRSRGTTRSSRRRSRRKTTSTTSARRCAPSSGTSRRI